MPRINKGGTRRLLIMVVLATLFHPHLVAEESNRDLATARVDALGDPLPDGALLRLGTKRFHHPSPVIELALSPDEKTLVTIGRDELIVWEAANGKIRWRTNVRERGIFLSGASYGIKALAFASDSSRFYTPGASSQFIAWNVASGEPEVFVISPMLPLLRLATQRDAGKPKAIDVTSDGQKIALGSANGVIVCDAKGKVLYEIANAPKAQIASEEMNQDRLLFGGHYSFGRFSPNQKLLAIVTSDTPNELRLHAAETGNEVRRIRLTSRLVRFAFSPDGRQIVATERDIAARLYDVDSGKELWMFQIQPMNRAESYTSAVAYLPDANLIAVGAPIGSDNEIRLLDPTDGKEVGKLVGHTWKPWALAPASSNMLYSSGWDGAVRRWNIAMRQQLPLPEGVRATGVVTASPDGRVLAYEDDLGKIHLIGAHDGKELRILELPETAFSCLTFSPDSNYLAAGGTVGDNVCVRVWDLRSGEIVRRWDWPKGRDPHSSIECICFRPDAKQLAACVFRQSSAYLWDLTTGDRIAQLKHSEVYGLSFSPNNKTLATAGWDKVVRFWNTSTGEIQRQVDVSEGRENGGDLRMYTVCYAPAGGLLATAHLDGMVRIWNAADMALQREFQAKGRFTYGSICFSPDGWFLATGNSAGQVVLWDPLTGEEMLEVGQHEHYVYTANFGNDNRTLVSGGEDGVSYLWDLQPRGQPPEQDLNVLWKDLAGNGPTAYRAMWAMTQLPDQTVTFLTSKLRPATIVMDLDRILKGLLADEAKDRAQLIRDQANKNEKVVLSSAARRGIAVLSQLGTPDAIRLLRELAERDPNSILGKMASAALDRSGTVK